MKSIIISIGDEILIGQVVNTNAAWLGKELTAIGIPPERVLTIPDDENEIINEFKAAFKKYNVIIVTGGLGPTHDDLTVKSAAKFFKSKYILNQKVLKHVKHIFARRKINMPAVNIGQALVPEIAKVLHNKTGTAPGLLFDKKGRVLCIMPGVPYEMKYICKTGLFPYLRNKFAKRITRVIRQKTLHTIGIGESLLAEKIGDISKIVRKKRDFEVKLAFLPSNYEVRLRITAIAKTELKAKKLINDAVLLLYKKAGKYIYSDDESPIEKTIGVLLKKRGLKLAVAESCTGGLVCSKITDVAGSSDYLSDGIVAYSNEAKKKLLGVKSITLKKFGAVSEKTAKEMAEGVKRRSKADIGISTTGTAGPTGATRGKPVGTVWIGFSDRKNTFAKKFIFSKDRLRNKDIISKMALEIVRQQLTPKSQQL
ncbi:MAG: competence/damage-inducible protein A [Ignavibacteria bacterium]|nr:competence/damage-inducible protein A [Ignavibacteria bacterium]